jgi:triosephosphate isomerase
MRWSTQLRAALSHGLRPILCVGETKPQRNADQAEVIVVGQVSAAWLISTRRHYRRGDRL